MTIPDTAVYAILPIAAAAALWAAKAFVDERTRRRTTTTTVTTTQPQAPAHVELTIGDFRQIADLLKAELNGRYMFANEAREKFDELGERLDNRVEELKSCIQQLTRDPHSRTRCTD